MANPAAEIEDLKCGEFIFATTLRPIEPLQG